MFKTKNKKVKHQPKKVKTKIGKRRINNGETTVRVTPLEDEFQFVSMLRIDLGGKRVGAYLLKKGENNYIVQFGFECKGIHSTLRSEQVEPTFDLLEAGLKDLPENERLTIHLGSFTSEVGVPHYCGNRCKPGGWSSKEAQMKYFWDNVMSREDIYDTEIYCQMMRTNDALVKTNMQRITKQSNVSAQLAKDKNSIDVKSLLNIEDAVAAQAELYRDAVTIHTAVVFLVYRNSRSKLDDACRHLQSLFLRPAWVLRETEYPWKLWLQTFPITWDRLLTTPFNRRLPYLSGEAPGFMPAIALYN